MKYFTKHTILPNFSDEKTRMEFFYINSKYKRKVEYNCKTNVIEIDTMFKSDIVNDIIRFDIIEGEQIYNPEIYYMLP